MKNTWIHSIVVILLASMLIAVTKASTSPVLAILSGLFSDPDAAPRLLASPLSVFALLAPGLLSGWFVRRHPLLVGAAAGALAAVLAFRISSVEIHPHSLYGDVLASAMVVAVAALAGRALRYRFRPADSKISRSA